MNNQSLLEKIANTFELTYLESQDSLGTLRFEEPASFNSIELLEHLADKGVISFEKKTSADKYLHFEVSALDEERLNTFIENETQRRESLQEICDEKIDSGSMLSNLFSDVTKLKGNWVFDGTTMSTLIPSSHGTQGSTSLGDLRNPQRQGSGETYRFMATLDFLVGQGAIEFFIDKDESSPSIHITKVNPDLVRAAAQDANLQNNALKHLKDKFSRPKALESGAEKRGELITAEEMKAAVANAADQLDGSNPKLAEQLRTGLEAFNLTLKQQRKI